MKALRIILVSFVLILLTSGTPPSFRILLLGDSITLAGYTENGFAHILQQRLGGRAVIINAGINGAKALDVLANWDEYVALKPDCVVIYLGTNDIKRFHHGDETWEEYHAALLKLATLAPRTILATPHRGIETPSRKYFLVDVEKVAAFIRTLGYPVADLYPLCCEETQLLDYAHPNDEGHQIIADAIYPLLLRSLYLE